MEIVTPTYERRTTAVPDQIGRIRGELAAFAARAGATSTVVDDVRLAVTEACTNALVHAYAPGEPAPLYVRADTAADALEICIRDWGAGLRADTGTGGLGLGLPLLHQLAHDVEVIEPESGGVEVRMRFPLQSFAGMPGTPTRSF